MKTALISDIHGNLEALTAVLSDIERQGVDQTCCLGDVIGYGSDPTACLALVSRHCDVTLMGNHEHLVLGQESPDGYSSLAREAANWTKRNMTDADLETIAAFKVDHRLDDIYLVHASPCRPLEWHYIMGPDEAAVAFEHLDGRLCFHGHTHIPVIFTEMAGQAPKLRAGHSFQPNEEDRYLVNIGSVGQPRDADPRSCYVVYDSSEGEVTYHRVEYNIEKAQSKMSQAQLPELLADRLAVGR